MKRTKSSKLFVIMGLFLWVAVVRLLTGCAIVGAGNKNADKVRDLEFTVAGDGDVPEELLN